MIRATRFLFGVRAVHGFVLFNPPDSTDVTGRFGGLSEAIPGDMAALAAPEAMPLSASVGAVAAGWTCCEGHGPAVELCGDLGCNWAYSGL